MLRSLINAIQTIKYIFDFSSQVFLFFSLNGIALYLYEEKDMGLALCLSLLVLVKF